MHGFIIVCDVTNLQSMREVQGWLETIENRAQITDGRQTMVLVNKIDTLMGLEYGSQANFAESVS